MLHSYPDFISLHLFPTFADCPNDDNLPLPAANTAPKTFLLGTIQLEATVSTSPTYICHDRTGAKFAVILRLPPGEIKEGVRGGGFDLAAWKRGWCLAIPDARKSGERDGKQGYIPARRDDVFVFPTRLERLMEICQSQNNFGANRSHKFNLNCGACGAEEGQNQLHACRGCQAIWYCNKACQLRGWNEKSHKRDCKTLKALKQFPSPGKDVTKISSI
ncbi:hypothetical protein K3495_g12957 [Podosphaera aphanis]|nr:hypothetical protein K3495_g12957 [Podosphaera aphanis]